MNKKNIEQILKNLGTKETPAHVQQLAEKVSADFSKTLTHSNKHLLWSDIMKTKTIKFATAAVIIIAALFSITIFDKTMPSAYAIEQTVEAFKSVRYMHMVRHNEAGQIEDERWVEIGSDGFQYRYRQDTPSHGFFVVDDHQTVSVHHKDKNTIVLYDPKDKSFTWHYAPGKLFEELANNRETVTIEENVDYWGRPAHLVRSNNMEFYIEPDTKLPIASGGYEFSYEDPPEGTFAIVIPDGVVVVDKRSKAESSQEPQWLADAKKDEDIAQESFNEARKASAAGQYKKAVELFKKVVEIQPGRNWAWFWLGQAHYKLGEYDAAIYEFSKVVGMFAKYNIAPYYCHLARGFAYQAKGMEDMAKTDFSITLPIMIDSLRHIGTGQFDFADNPMRRGGGLLEGGHEKPSKQQSVAMMINRLRILTGQSFGYDSNISIEENEQVIAAWEKWFEDSGEINFTPSVELIPISK